MQARFKLSLLVEDDLVELTESELGEGFDTAIDHLRAADPIEGAVMLIGPHIREFVIPDEMTPLILGFCFEPAVALLEQKKEAYVYYFFNTGSVCAFLADGDLITLLSDDDQEEMPTIRCPTGELLPALYQCGLRYVDFLQRLVDSGRDDAAALEQLREAAERARRALAGRALLPK